jgi:rhamnulokinase
MEAEVAKARAVAAVDLGAESGRVMLARFDGQRLALDEVHRFPNLPVMARDHRFWNLLGLWEESLAGLRKARQTAGALDSIGVDTWGVDYGLVNEAGLLRSMPFCYRDHRTDDAMDPVFVREPRAHIYARTGIQFMPFNTLFQLYAHERDYPGELAGAHRLLLLPDLLHSWLCGEMLCEESNATTTQCWDPVGRQWATDLLDRLDIPTTMLPQVVPSGTVLGSALPEWRGDLGTPRIIAPVTHDTGSAIAAAPASDDLGWAYISSGTWSLVGVELPRPLITPETQARNWTNEGGAFGTTRFLKNVMGLWLLQECQRAWARLGGAVDYDDLFERTDQVAAHTTLIDPDDPRFLAPDDMPAAINDYLRERGQAPLHEPEAYARCIMESLVLRYCEALGQAATLTGQPIDRIHVFSGGSRNVRLNQWLADAAGIPVLAGPVEATALGNALMQLAGLGEARSMAEIRAISRRSTALRVFEPRANQRAIWDGAADRFAALGAARPSER